MGITATYYSPAGTSALVDAVQWIQGVALGSLATIAATVAVATIGLMMLNGRLHVRRGAIAILGCFIVFGAPQIAAGILGTARLGSVTPEAVGEQPQPVAGPAPAVPSPAPIAPYDPYAGASVPYR